MGKTIRIDMYYGFQDERGPRERHQIFYDIENQDIDECTDVLRACFEEAVSDLINELEDDDNDSAD